MVLRCFILYCFSSIGEKQFFGKQHLCPKIKNCVDLILQQALPWILFLLSQQQIQQLLQYSQIAMFQEQLQSSSSHNNRQESFSNSSQSISLNVQYEICSKFMKMASEQIYQKELQMINTTSKFLQKTQDLMAQKDISSTQESMTIETFFDEDQSFSQPSKSRLLLRKSKSNTSIKRSENGLNQALRQVQRKCSGQTSSMLSNMAGEYRRVKQKLACSENEKELKRLEARFSTIEEELLINRKRVSDLEKQNKIQLEDNNSLKKRLKQADLHRKQASLTLSKSSDQLKHLNNGPADKIKRFLELKEMQIFKKQKQIKSIQDKIQKALDSNFTQNGCQKCCGMMRRVKEGIMRYRAFLEEQANTAEQYYNSFKKQFS